MNKGEMNEIVKDAQKSFARNFGKGGRTLLFVYCGGYGVVDSEHYYLLNDDQKFVYSIESTLKILSK